MDADPVDRPFLHFSYLGLILPRGLFKIKGLDYFTPYFILKPIHLPSFLSFYTDSITVTIFLSIHLKTRLQLRHRKHHQNLDLFIFPFFSRFILNKIDIDSKIKKIFFKFFFTYFNLVDGSVNIINNILEDWIPHDENESHTGRKKILT